MPEITYRPVRDTDQELNFRIYASTRADEMARVGWSDAEKEAFLRFQYRAQKTHYDEHFPDAAFDLILVEGEPAGRLYVDRRPDEIRLVDIALLPQRRGQGIGGRILRSLLAEGEEKALVVRIHVERDNPAMRLYRRLGFEKVAEQGVYDLMEWTPASAAGKEDDS